MQCLVHKARMKDEGGSADEESGKWGGGEMKRKLLVLSLHLPSPRLHSSLILPPSALLLFAVFGFEHVLDVVFEQEDIRRGLAVYFEGRAVIPLNCAFDLFAVL